MLLFNFGRVHLLSLSLSFSNIRSDVSIPSSSLLFTPLTVRKFYKELVASPQETHPHPIPWKIFSFPFAPTSRIFIPFDELLLFLRRIWPLPKTFCRSRHLPKVTSRIFSYYVYLCELSSNPPGIRFRLRSSSFPVCHSLQIHIVSHLCYLRVSIIIILISIHLPKVSLPYTCLFIACRKTICRAPAELQPAISTRREMKLLGRSPCLAAWHTTSKGEIFFLRSFTLLSPQGVKRVWKTWKVCLGYDKTVFINNI